MHLYHDQFSESYDFPRVEQPLKILIIASTGRCGSHMLGHALHKTNSFGFPLEYVNPANLAEWKNRLHIDDFHEVLTEVQRRRTSLNGVFGIKIHYSHIKQFGGFSHLQEVFPNAYYLLLSREDILRQAVSLSIAKQNGVWIHGQKPVNNNLVYNFREIDKCLRQSILENSSWRYVLSAKGCNYIEMKFDQVLNNPSQSIEEIASFIGIELDSNKIPREQVVKKQSNDINSDWTSRFISDFDEAELLSDKKYGSFNEVKNKINKFLRS